MWAKARALGRRSEALVVGPPVEIHLGPGRKRLEHGGRSITRWLQRLPRVGPVGSLVTPATRIGLGEVPASGMPIGNGWSNRTPGRIDTVIGRPDGRGGEPGDRATAARDNIGEIVMVLLAEPENVREKVTPV